MFDRLSCVGPVSVNGMIAAYALKGEYKLAIDVFNKFKHICDQAKDANTYISLLGTCTTASEAQEVHKKIQKSGLENVLRFENSLISKLGRMGATDSARKVLLGMREKDVVSWSAMISAYVQNGQSTGALQVLRDMDLEGVKPNNITFTSLVDAVSDEASALAIKNRIFFSSEIEMDSALYNAVLAMCGKFCCLEEARDIFETMENKDVVTWTTMIAASAEDGRNSEAAYFFHRMGLEGVKPTSITFLSLLDSCSSFGELEALHNRVLAEGYGANALLSTGLVRAYGKHKQVERARVVFDGMEARDVVAWTSMIRNYTEQEQELAALDLFQKMELEGVKPSHITLVTMLAVCSSLNFVVQGRKLHSRLVESGRELNPVAATELINIYGQCGSLEDARTVFDSLQDPGVAAWTSMIAAYAKSGRGRAAVKLLRSMAVEGVKPNRMTLSSALAACAHSGLQNEAWEIFLFVERDAGVALASEQYGAMIDVLGRAGEIEQARILLNNMPVKSDAKIWANFLGACRIHRKLDLGAQAARHLIRMDPASATPYALLARMYGEAGERDKEAEVIAAMEYRGISSSYSFLID